MEQCGCFLTRDPDIQADHSWEINYCPLHAVAEEMLDFLNACSVALLDWDTAHKTTRWKSIYSLIAKAEGRV